MPEARVPPESELCTARSSYIDSVEIQQTRFFRQELLRHMARYCGSTHGPKAFGTYGGRIRNLLWLHQPQREAIEYLNDKPATSIVSVHVALDLTTPSADATYLLSEYLRPRLVLNRVPKEPVKLVGDTLYLSFSAHRRLGKQLAYYDDSPSKVIPDSQCCHIEMRIRGAYELRRSHLRTPAELLALDHREFWKQHLMLLESPSATALGARWLKAFMRRGGKPTARYPYDSRKEAARRTGGRLLRAVQGEDGSPVANDLIHFLRQRRPLGPGSVSDLFTAVPIDWMLPTAENGLWKA